MATWANDRIEPASRFRLCPTPPQALRDLDQGWTMPRTRTRTGQEAPGRAEDVPAGYTSPRCNRCGSLVPENREGQAVFRYQACGHTGNADTNAARNIADSSPAVGRTVPASGDRAKPARSVKREPQRMPPRSSGWLRNSGDPGP
jgi:putative transposase